MIDINKVAGFLMDNPGAWFQLAEAVADCDAAKARQIGQAFQDMATFYGEPEAESEPDCDDADALASAGFGTDEDYGGDCDRI
jgi:hypothetical protein